ncbi:probable xyloglucan endotransglucosylase/hydrolase protein 8 isoform X2 [Nicotiana tomentosiformis]|uniref:probable xyloglucan endotransglucosylase/hydrolase protein 8 isoform X2 n=1 Tax=Nicotiana tomentosiformis TaxID=4098 RepID=UPI0008790A99|nr:probable xyloglucan endotransglucosylase/hydrolase protein 8 isoform X2 [Nicotiana tomentosiformis]
MERNMGDLLLFAALVATLFSSSHAQLIKGAFENTFSKSCPGTHFKTSQDGQIWYLTLDQVSDCGFITKQSYRFGWFSTKLKLVGGDSAGVVTAFYMCSEVEAGPLRDEIDFEFLGNRTGQPYLIQTNVYNNGSGGREMRHLLWFFVDKVPIRVYKNANHTNNFFPAERPMYVFSSIWNADNWATRGGLDKINWTSAPFVASYKEFTLDACQWKDPFPACVSTTTQHWWDQYNAWHLSSKQKIDYAWVQRNFVVYDYCQDSVRNRYKPQECWLSPLD